MLVLLLLVVMGCSAKLPNNVAKVKYPAMLAELSCEVLCCAVLF